jgi:micrococcal nuclease
MRHAATTLFITTILMGSPAWSATHSFKVDRVKDGDTILVTHEGKQIQLQLLGMDAPEDVTNPKLQKDMERTGLQQDELTAIGRQATSHLSRLTPPGETVEVEASLDQRDRYGRVPAVVRDATGRNVNAAMVEDGFAVVMGRYPFDAALKAEMQRLQEAAISNKRGLWSSHQRTTKAWSGK